MKYFLPALAFSIISITATATVCAQDFGDPAVVNAPNAAQTEVRFSAVEDELRVLRGQIEENQFQIRKLSENLDKMQKDIDYRLNELSTAAANAPTSAEKVGKPAKVAVEGEPPARSERVITASEAPDGPTTAGDGTLRLPDDDDEKGNFSSPREHYNYAFRLLNQNKYDEAATAFDSFTKKYPKDPLVGNAFYWEGESFYIKQDYVNAADYFRQGFEALPEGPKAADNLLKLAMSLSALNRTKEACVVLSQVVTKFKNSSTSVIGKAQQEQKRLSCK